MSCNNFSGSYFSCHAYPCLNNTCNNLFQNTPCQQQTCQTVCQPTCNPCPSLCNPCQTILNPCNPCSIPCPAVSYITTAITPTSIPSGTPGLAPTVIPVGSTTIPAGTVTVLGGFGTPTTNVGCISINASTNQFTVPIAGRYIISGNIGFASNPMGTREFYIYKVDGTTGVISLIVSDSRNATVVGNTFITLTTVADLRANDRIFFAATQNSGSTLATTDLRVAISHLC